MEMKKVQTKPQTEEPYSDPFPFDYLVDNIPKQVSQKTREKIEQILSVLNHPTINIKKLRKVCQNGIPDECKGLRSICWRLLIGYLPGDKSKWYKQIEENKKTFQTFQDEQFKKQKKNQEVRDQDDQGKNEEQKVLDKCNYIKTKDPRKITDPKDQFWNQHFQDQFLWDEIEKDTTRTRSELSFFVTPHKLLPPEQQVEIPFKTQVQNERLKQEDSSERHFDVLSRILYVYGKLNPAIKYVQGMNEILAPIYYAFCSDTNDYLIKNIESDAFFCFTIIMSDLMDNFIKQMDESDTGIKSKVIRFNKLLKIMDIEVWQNLDNLGVNPHYYSLRWLLLMLTQEFELFDVLRLWDSLLSHENKILYHNFLCLAIVQLRRGVCLEDDFAQIMEKLQHLEDVQILELIATANQLYEKAPKDIEARIE